jgi:hypothetical protein
MDLRRDVPAAMGVCALRESAGAWAFDGAETTGLVLMIGAALVVLLALRAFVRWWSESSEDLQ